MSDCTFVGNGGGTFPDYGCLFEGLGAGSATESGDTMTNGCLWRTNNVVVANSMIGLSFNGVGGGNHLNASCEGSQTITYEFRKSSAVTLIGMRSNAGMYAKLTDCINIQLQGFGIASPTPSHVEYKGSVTGCKGCIVNLQAESFATFVALEHRYGEGTEWVAYRYPEGHLVSKNNTAPTNGVWELGQVVWRKNNTSSEPDYWKCSVAGAPGTWVEGYNQP